MKISDRHRLARALLLSVMACMPFASGFATSAWAALPTHAEAEAILKKQLIDSGQAKGAAVALVDANGIRIVAPITITFGDMVDGKAGSFLFEQGGARRTAKRQ